MKLEVMCSTGARGCKYGIRTMKITVHKGITIVYTTLNTQVLEHG